MRPVHADPDHKPAATDYHVCNQCGDLHLHAMAGEHLEHDRDRDPVLPDAPVTVDEVWAGLDEALIPIVFRELVRQEAEQDDEPGSAPCDTCGDTGEIYEEGQPTGVHGGFAPCPDCRTTTGVIHD